MELGKISRKIIRPNLNNNQRYYLKYFLIFIFITIGFHFLYWETNMDAWLFGPFTSDVYKVFSVLAYKGTELFSKIIISFDFDSIDNSLWFYRIDKQGDKEYFAIMNVLSSCSGFKQILQLFALMIFLPISLFKRMIYFLVSIPIILFFNIIRISSLTWVLVYYPNNFQFFHDNIGRGFHYLIIFLLWFGWIRRFSNKRLLPQG